MITNYLTAEKREYASNAEHGAYKRGHTNKILILVNNSTLFRDDISDFSKKTIRQLQIKRAVK